MIVSVVSDTAEFEALRPAWSGLLERSGSASIFLSWEWLFSWWRHYGEARRLRVLVAREDGAVVGILPLYLDRSRLPGRIPILTLRFLGTGADTSPDDLGALLDPKNSGAIAAALANHALHHLKWDILSLTDIAEGSEFGLALEAALTPFASATGISARISYAQLPDTWDAYVVSQSANRRSTIRRTRRRVESLPGARLYALDAGQDLARASRRLAELHRMRWEGRTESHSFSSAEYLAFHLDVMRRCQARDWLRMYCLELDGALIAMIYCYRFRDQIFYFQSGFDPAFSKLSPGLVLMGFAIEQAIAEKLQVFDMLRGEYDYKTQWAPERRVTRYFRAYRRSPAVYLWRLRHVFLPRLKRRLMAPGAARSSAGGTGVDNRAFACLPRPGAGAPMCRSTG